MRLLSWLNPRNWSRPAARDLTYADLLRKGWARGTAEAGVPVTRETALGVSAVWCADRVIAGDISTLPKRVYDGDHEESAELARHPVAWLLTRPNPETTGPVFWEAYQSNANIWGFAAAEIVRDRRGIPVELWLVPSPLWRIDRQAGRLTFKAPGNGGGEATLDPDDVLFLPGPSPDGSVGYRLLDVARTTIGTAAAAQRFGAARFRNGMMPTGLIKHPGVLSDQARENMRQSWRALYSGPDNAGVPMLLEEGTDWVKGEIAHNDQLQLAELSEFLIDEVARFFNVSPVKLHKLGRATWANLETLNREHVTACLGPWLAKHEAEIGVKLLRSDRTGRTCRHNLDRLLSADTATRFEAWSSALNAGWMTPNEVRRREDLPPLPGGNDLHRPLNQGPAAGGATPPADPPANPPIEVPTDAAPAAA